MNRLKSSETKDLSVSNINIMLYLLQSLTCEQYTPMGIKQKENYIKEINVITTASDPLSDVTATLASLEISADFNSEIVALQQQLADILVYTDCPTCTEPTKHRYRECSKVEEEKFRQAIFEFDDELKTYISQNLSNVEPKRFVKYLIKQTENMINKLLSVRAIREYYDKKLESFHTVYVETKRKLENYIITNDIYAVGKTIVDSLRIAVGKLNPNPRCRIVSELNGLSDETVQIITPFSASKYLQPSLNSFARKYGGATDTGDLESVRSYERVFGSAEQTLLNSSRMNGPSLALDSLRNVLRSIDEFLGNASTCLGSVLTDEDGDVYDLLLCLSEANFKSSDIATLRISLSQCYGNYQMKAYCLGGISRLPEVTRYNELVSCLSIALKSPNKDDVACCFK